MDQFKQLKSMGLWLGIILIGLGAVLLLWPESVIGFLATIAGAGVVLFGIVKGAAAIKVWRADGKGKISRAAFAALLLALGLYVLINTNVTVAAVGICIGIFALISALDRFSLAVERKKSGHKYFANVCFGLINLVFGLGMIGAALSVMSYVLMIVGIYLIAAGIMVIVSSKVLFDL